MWVLALSSAFFLCIHLMISGTILKQQIISSIGSRAYGFIFGLFSMFGFFWMIFSFESALRDTQNIVFWRPPFELKILNFIANFIATNLFALGVLSPSPTNLAALKKENPNPVRGIIRVTRHPVLAAIAIFSLSHGIVNGNLASWIFFGSLFCLSILGAHSIDYKRTLLLGESYKDIMKQTSIIPFVAIFSGRTRFKPMEIGIIRLMLSVSSFTVLVVLHEILFRYPAL